MAEQLTIHAGHPLNADRWCVNDRCNAQAVATQAQIVEEQR